MNQRESGKATALATALGSSNSSHRLTSVLAAGTHPDDSLIDILIHRCSIEPDFFVRDMLTWALLRHNLDLVYPKLLLELYSSTAQARSQALHTLTKIGNPESWKHISDVLLFDEDSEVARAAWRLSSNLSPEAERPALVEKLVKILGFGDEEVKLSLSRAIAQLGESAKAPLLQLAQSDEDEVSTHAKFTLALIEKPELGQSHAVGLATKIDLLSGAPKAPDEIEGLS